MITTAYLQTERPADHRSYMVDLLTQGVTSAVRADVLASWGAFHVEFDTFDARDAFVASFPKSVKVKPAYIQHVGSGVKTPMASLRIIGEPNATTGEKNEAGAKRFDRFVAGFAALLA